jgi:hypothetical protein
MSLLIDVFNFTYAFVYGSQRCGLSKRDDGACLKLESIYNQLLVLATSSLFEQFSPQLMAGIIAHT